MKTTIILALAAASLIYLLFYVLWVRKARRDHLAMEHKRIRSIKIHPCAAQPLQRAPQDEMIDRLNGELNAEPQFLRGDGLELACFGCVGGRREQQDAVEISLTRAQGGERAVAVLCDGMGGLQEGGQASKITAGRLRACLAGDFAAETLSEAVCECLSETDSLISNICDEAGNNVRAGTTAITAAVENGVLFWSSVGDSRIYFLREEKLAQLSRDHNYLLELNKKVMTGELTQEQAETDKKREALISYVGIGGLPLVDHNGSGNKIMSGDMILLCSDGLYKALTDAEISHISQQLAGDVQAIAKRLVSEAIHMGGARQDNTTVAIIRLL